jgi:hypothetical protein
MKAVVRYFLVNDQFGHYAYYFTAGFQSAISHFAHQSDIATTIYKGDITAGY